jgi:hypothetical protein
MIRGVGPYSTLITPQAGSLFNAAFHPALCHLPKGSAAERRQLREIEALRNGLSDRITAGAVQPGIRFGHIHCRARRPRSGFRHLGYIREIAFYVDKSGSM